jgi:hypothetical protein
MIYFRRRGSAFCLFTAICVGSFVSACGGPAAMTNSKVLGRCLQPSDARRSRSFSLQRIVINYEKIPADPATSHQADFNNPSYNRLPFRLLQAKYISSNTRKLSLYGLLLSFLLLLVLNN